jgi:hypothetical protein
MRLAMMLDISNRRRKSCETERSKSMLTKCKAVKYSSEQRVSCLVNKKGLRDM